MSDKLTRVRLKSREHYIGQMEYGEVSVEETIASVRSYADRLRNELAVLDAAKDEDFQIDVVLGPIVQRHVKELQRAAGTTKDKGE